MKKFNSKRGFTLIELLVVVAIIGILASVVLAALNNARGKGADAAIKQNLANAIRQAEIFYNSNTVAIETYTSVCVNPGPVGGANTLYALVLGAAQASGLVTYSRNAIGTATTATCNDSAAAWAAEAPLKSTAGQMWCVDSTGKSKQETGSSLSAANDYTCV